MRTPMVRPNDDHDEKGKADNSVSKSYRRNPGAFPESESAAVGDSPGDGIDFGREMAGAKGGKLASLGRRFGPITGMTGGTGGAKKQAKALASTTTSARGAHPYRK